MKKLIKKALVFTLAFIFAGCAATYKPIQPNRLNFIPQDVQDGIAISYRHDVLREKKNNKYARKELKNGVKVVAVKITNNTEQVLNAGTGFVFYSGPNQILPMEPEATMKFIRQVPAQYLFYLLLTPVYLNIETPSSSASLPIGLILGPALSIGNLAVASSANKNMMNELTEFNILRRDIQPGETVYGLIGFRESAFNPISVRRVR